MKVYQSRKLAVGAVFVCLLGAGFAATKQGPTLPSNATAAEAPTSGELVPLLKARYDSAAALLQMEEKRLKEGSTTLVHVCEAARRVKDSAIELPLPPEERLRALTDYLAVTRELEANVSRAVEIGAAPPTDRESARYLRLDAEIACLRAKGNMLPKQAK